MDLVVVLVVVVVVVVVVLLVVVYPIRVGGRPAMCMILVMIYKHQAVEVTLHLT